MPRSTEDREPAAWGETEGHLAEGGREADIDGEERKRVRERGNVCLLLVSVSHYAVAAAGIYVCVLMCMCVHVCVSPSTLCRTDLHCNV